MISDATLTAIQLTPAAASIVAGLTQQYIAQGIYSDNSSVDISNAVAWHSSDTAIATVNTTGLATALTAGPATISISLNGISATAYLNVTAATLTAIQLTPAAASIAAGLTQQYIAQGTYSDNSSVDISNAVAWHSSDTAIATVNTAGLATTLIAGSTTISASLNGITTFAHLDVTAATLTAIQLTPAAASIVAGLTQQYIAQGIYSDNSSVDISNAVAWHSSDTAIATVNTTGLATALAAGPATISVSLNGISATAYLNVTAATLTAIQLTPAAASIAAGLTQQYIAQGTYSDNSSVDISNMVAWHSSDTAIATVNTTGLATALTAGPATISISLNGISATAYLNVTAATLTAIQLTPAAASIAAGLTQQYIAQGTYSDNSSVDISNAVAWHSSDTAIATVNTTGLATALAAGPATISVSLNGISATAYLNVTAATLTAIQLTPATSSIASRLTQQYIAQGTYSDNTSADISNMVAWHSSDTTVATVNTAGLATTLIAGSTTISASLNGITTFAHLDVTAATLTAIQLTPATASIVAGLTQQYTAQGTYSNNLSVDISSMVAWHSSDTAIATVDTTGLATTLTAGPATISVSLDGISATATLGVRPSSPRVVTWGATFYGGDSSAVQAQLTNVSAIYSTGTAVAAQKQDGSVVTWGNAGFGGDSSAVQAQLTNVRAISNSDGAFAALKQDGSVVTWGSTVYGSDSSAVQAQLTNVRAISNSDGAFAALKQDGSVVSWGNAGGGDSSAVQAQLTNVKAIYGNIGAFAALKQDGSVVTWGATLYGSDSSAVQAQLTNVRAISNSDDAFAALKQDGSVVTWGSTGSGGDSSAVQAQLTNVKAIYNAQGAFAALKQDGSVVSWGNAGFGGDSSAVQAQLTNVKAIYGNIGAFAALKQDGSVVTWGATLYGGDSSAVQAQLTNVRAISNSDDAFAALKQDGSVVTWGSTGSGGDSSAVQAQLTNVKAIYGNIGAFAALKQDGSVVSWGNAGFGGDSSAVQAQLTNVKAIYSNPRSFAAMISP